MPQQWTGGRSSFALPVVTVPAMALALALGVVVAASLFGADATWDFRNYHLYDPFALLNKPFGTDIAPAHMQSFFAPTMDLFYYALARSVSSTPVLNVLASLPQALAVVLAFLLTCRLLRPQTGTEVLALGIFAAIGATGVAGGSTIATTASEMLPASAFLLALFALIPRDLASTPSLRRVLLAGLLAGVACGLKLTMSYRHDRAWRLTGPDPAPMPFPTSSPGRRFLRIWRAPRRLRPVRLLVGAPVGPIRQPVLSADEPGLPFATGHPGQLCRSQLPAALARRRAARALDLDGPRLLGGGRVPVAGPTFRHRAPCVPASCWSRACSSGRAGSPGHACFLRAGSSSALRSGGWSSRSSAT